MAWSQELYFVKGWRSIDANFADTSPFSRLQDQSLALYLSRAGGGTDELVVPENLDDLVGAFTSLGAEDREKALRSAYWLYVANRVWDYSTGVYFLATIQAIETLSEPIPSERCSECGKPKVGATAGFKDTLRRYCLPEQIKSAAKLSRMRNKLTHGGTLTEVDEEIFPRFEDPGDLERDRRRAEEDMLMVEATQISRRVFTGWLLDVADPSRGLGIVGI